MKFSDLRIGETFFLDGERYRKTSPLMACSETGNQERLVRRSVTIQLMEGETPQCSAGETAIEAPNSLLEHYHNAVRQLIEQQAGENHPLIDALESLYREFRRKTEK